MQPRGNDFCGLVRGVAIKPRENSVRGCAQIEGDAKAKEGEKFVLHRALSGPTGVLTHESLPRSS
jgi:hypothetical protein